jgi:hypothetical protein
MGRMLRVMALAAVIAAIVGGLLGGTREAAAGNGYEQWTGPYANGCSVYWDGFAYGLEACPRSDGAYDFYVPSNGAWAFGYTAGYDAGGCFFVWNGHTYTVYTCPDSTVDFAGWLAPMQDSTTWTPTGNVLIDGMMGGFEAGILKPWSASTCVEVISNVCYTS